MSDKPRILQRPDDIRNPKPRRVDSPAAECDEKAHAEFARKWLEASRLEKLQDRFDYIAEGCRILLRSLQLPDQFGQFVVCGDAWEAAEEEPDKRQKQTESLYQRINAGYELVNAPLREGSSRIEYIPNLVRHPALLLPTDTYQHAAATLLDHCDYAHELLAKGSNTVEAMRIALDIGTRAATLAILRRWEPDALDGEHTRTVVRSKGGKRKAIPPEIYDRLIAMDVELNPAAGDAESRAGYLLEWAKKQPEFKNKRMPKLSTLRKRLPKR